MRFEDIKNSVAKHTQRGIEKVRALKSGDSRQKDTSFEATVQRSRSFGGKMSLDNVDKRDKPVTEWMWKGPWLALGVN